MDTYPIVQGGQLLLPETISDVVMAGEPVDVDVDVDVTRLADVLAGETALLSLYTARATLIECSNHMVQGLESGRLTGAHLCYDSMRNQQCPKGPT